MDANIDKKWIRRVLLRLVTELDNSQEAWKLSQELSRQLEVKPLAQVLHDHLPDVEHQDAAEKMAAAVVDMYSRLNKKNTGEALALAAAFYILSKEERGSPYALGLTAVDLVEGRMMWDAVNNEQLTPREKASAFYDYYYVFTQRDALMLAKRIEDAVRKLFGTS